MLYGIHRTVENNVSLAGGMLTAELLCGYTALLAVVAYSIAVRASLGRRPHVFVICAVARRFVGGV